MEIASVRFIHFPLGLRRGYEYGISLFILYHPFLLAIIPFCLGLFFQQNLII